MALFSELTPCSLCGEAIGTDADTTIGFTYLASSNPLVAQLDDTVVHQACLDSWEERDEFVAAWNREAKSVLSQELIVTKDGHVEYRDR